MGVGGEAGGIIQSYSYYLWAGIRTAWGRDSSLTVAFVLPQTVVTITLTLNYCT